MLLRLASPSDPITNAVLTGFERSAPAIMQDLEFYIKTGSADSVKRAKATSTKSDIFRALNEDNTPDAYTPVYDPVAKKIVSFDVKVDVQLEDRNEDPEAELAQLTVIEAESVGYSLQEAFFEGNDDVSEGNPLSFKGLRALADEYGNIIQADYGIAPVGGADNTIITQQQQFIEELTNFFKRIRGGATHAYMHEDVKTRLLNIAKNLGYYRTAKDELGNEIEMIRGVIIRGAGYKENGDLLLPFTEADDTSSIFACRFGERTNLTCLTSVGVKARYAGQIGNFLINNVNMDAAMHLQAPTALYQLTGITLGSNDSP